MQLKKISCTVYAGALFTLLSTIALAVNLFIYHYPGNIYFPINAPEIGVTILLSWAGAVLQFGKQSKLAHILKDVFSYYLLMLIITYAATAMQFTPFPPIDKYISAFESNFYINMDSIVAWTHSHPSFYDLLTAAYESLEVELTFFPIVVIVARKKAYFDEFVFFVIVSTMIGGIFYYFFPTTAPASLSSSPFFIEAQHATGLKFYEIHHYIQPSTLAGGMVSLPSYHVIWAWWVQYSVRMWPWVFYPLLVLNILLTMSCVLLGWHYPTDIIGSVIVILITYGIYYACYNKKKTHLLANKKMG